MAGRPTAYKPEMLEKAKAYIEGGYKDLDQIIPSIAGLAVHLGVAKSTIYKWCEDKDHPFSDILALSNATQEVTLINGGLSGKLNSTITKLVLGKHGYSEKTETEHKGGVRIFASELDESI